MNKAVLYACSLILIIHPLTSMSGEEISNMDQHRLPPARKIPGVTAEDEFPRGCVDCHINMPDRNQDERISTLMSKWNVKVEPELLELAQGVAPAGVTLKGLHPKVRDSLQDIPAGCLVCHDETSTRAPPLAPLVHTIHLSGGDNNHFLTIFQGECTHCHKMEYGSANWTMPSGSEK